MNEKKKSTINVGNSIAHFSFHVMASSKQELADKRDLAELTTSIRQKFIKLKEAESKFQSSQARFFQPILKSKAESAKIKAAGSSGDGPFPATMNKAAIQEILDHGNDKLYGIVKSQGVYKFGTYPITVLPTGITLRDKKFATTLGLLSLLTRKNPLDYNDSDLADYATAILTTGIHLTKEGRLKNTQSIKFQTIIRPLFELPPAEDEDLNKSTRTPASQSSNRTLQAPSSTDTLYQSASFDKSYSDHVDGESPAQEPSTSSSFTDTPKSRPKSARDSSTRQKKKGSGFVTKKIIKPGARQVDSQYVYWDSVNELVERLHLLHSARQAGNTSVVNEIANIEAELREAKIIR